MTLSDKLKVLRLEKKMTRKAVAEQTGMSIATYSAYEDGKRVPKRNPENYEKLAALFGCTVEYLKDDSVGQVAAIKPEKSKRKPKGGKAPVKKASIRVELQYGGRAIDISALVSKAQKLDAEITDLYLKPEENTAYYVAGQKSGSFTIF